MNRNRILAGVAAIAVLAIGLTVYAQVARPYHDGTVWTITQIRIKPGMNEAYLAYLASQWKAQNEAAKSAGFILSYKAIETEAHGPQDFNMLLMVEYKDMATMEANADKMDALMQKVVGDDQKQMQGYKDRAEIREVLGTRLCREIVLAPK